MFELVSVAKNRLVFVVYANTERASSEIGRLSKILEARLALISFLLLTAMVQVLYRNEIA